MYSYNRYSQRSSNKVGWIVAGIVAVLAVFLIFHTVKAYYGDDLHTGCVVNDKDRVHTDSGSEMRIYTDNCGVFVVSDSLVKTDFNSADRYNQVKVGKTYDIKSYGFRFGLFSMFPKIVEVTEVK